MKSVLIINAHPRKDSFCRALAENYMKGTEESGAEVKLINLIDLEFDPVLKTKNTQSENLEPDILKAQDEISKAGHLVFVYPNWWGTYPALLKGFFDRVFTSGFAFRYRKNSNLPEKLLTGKTARVIVTMDTPLWYYSIGYKKPGHNSIKRSILGLCGISPVRITAFSPIRHSTPEKREKWLEKVYQLGTKLK
jgi:putative NADPH-quinone reductase